MNIMNGRRVATAMNGGHGSLTLCSADLDPCVTVAARKEFLGKVSRSPDTAHSTAMTGGDLNCLCSWGGPTAC
eukprot:9047340-Pyramimonas_sp.AAC.1